MDANKKIDLKHPLCPNERKLLANILQNHPLRFSIVVSSSVPWIYLGQFWHTLKEDGSKYRLKFVLDRKELTLTLDDFRIIFHLPQATDNNHDHFVPTPKFSKMVPFYINNLGFILEFIKLIVSHYMTAFPEIFRRARDKYHNLEDDEMVKSIFNSRKHKDGVRMIIPNWMITDEMKLIKNYWMYVMVFRVDVPMTQSQIIESTQGMYRLTSAPRTPNPDVAEGELEPESNKESLEVEITDAEEPVNVIEEEEESPRIHYTLISSDTEKLKELTVNDPPPSSNTPSSSSPKPKLSASQHILSLFKPKTRRFKRYKSFFDELQGRYKYLFEHLKTRPSVIRPRDQDDPHDDAHPERENSAKRQKTTEHGTYVFGESSSGQVNESRDDDELPTEKVSQELIKEMSQTIDEAKLRKVVNEIKEILVSPHPQKPTPVIQSCQSDPKAPALSLVNQDLLYLKKGNSGPEKIVMSLHKFPIIIFPDDDIEERTSIWVDKCVKKFNPYARYNVEHWKNPHAKILYIKKQEEPEKSKEVVYSNSKIVQIIKTYWKFRHEHKYITKIITRRANGSIVSITKSDYKNLNKNDIEDMYLLIVNGKVDDYAETRLMWSLSVFIRSTYKMFSIVSELVYVIIYKNNKKEKRVTRHQEVHKFCDATLKRVLKGLKSYNNNVKHGYVTPSLSKEDAEYLQLFKEETKERLKHHDQMRR
ncbi:hypothetical protein Tco_0212739 [Tanacetum coccineum]